MLAIGWLAENVNFRLVRLTRSPRTAAYAPVACNSGSARAAVRTGAKSWASAPSSAEVGKVFEQVELGEDPGGLLTPDGDEGRRPTGQQRERFVERR